MGVGVRGGDKVASFRHACLSYHNAETSNAMLLAWLRAIVGLGITSILWSLSKILHHKINKI